MRKRRLKLRYEPGNRFEVRPAPAAPFRGTQQTELERLKAVAIHNGNLFEELMETVKCCSLGQITHALYEVGGQYRRNM